MTYPVIKISFDNDIFDNHFYIQLVIRTTTCLNTLPTWADFRVILIFHYTPLQRGPCLSGQPGLISPLTWESGEHSILFNIDLLIEYGTSCCGHLTVTLFNTMPYIGIWHAFSCQHSHYICAGMGWDIRAMGQIVTKWLKETLDCRLIFGLQHIVW